MQARSGADIYSLLIQAIEDGDLKPGDRLRETELAERFGVSRTPIRETLKQLEAQGLARHEPNRGMVIPTLEHDEINQLYMVREVLEGTAARFAAQHATDVEIAILQDGVAADREIIDEVDKLVASNRVFHRRLTLASHNRYLVLQVEHMKQYLLLLDGTTFTDPDRRAGAVEEHSRLIEAVAARDLDKAEEYARLHIRKAHRARLESL
ncbi:GntR family transcriptional regulator [Pelagibius sp. Alg239-R121]|uniref:GntR family transcriptional regulator n=1 Tax=Pelagibius sp. Alg239-R121 TaxID=2993448 RepID=UPI0024A7A46B|nr:GntR family transcriptional regulator [Pelagibius sp. Alg239-R121]